MSLAGALLIEQNDEWLVGRRNLSVESLAGLYVAEPPHEPAEPTRSAPQQAREVAVVLTT